MPDDELSFDDSHLNTFSDEDRFEVTAERIAEYAAATNDPIAAHRNGDIAPPVFAPSGTSESTGPSPVHQMMR